MNILLALGIGFCFGILAVLLYNQFFPATVDELSEKLREAQEKLKKGL